MINSFIIKVQGFLFDPVATFRQAREDGSRILFSYFGVLLFVNTVLSALFAFIPGIRNPQVSGAILSGLAFLILTMIGVMIMIFIMTIIIAAWIHLWVYLFGGRKGILQTFKAILYGETPLLLLGWVPLIGMIFIFWSIALSMIGIRELQEMSTQNAVLAVIAAILSLLIILVLLVALLMASNMVFLPFPYSLGLSGI
jgi:hypothetical protein